MPDPTSSTFSPDALGAQALRLFLHRERRRHVLTTTGVLVLVFALVVVALIDERNTAVEAAKQSGFENGHARGLEEGLADGLRDGLASGRAEGRAESVGEIDAARDAGYDEGHAAGLAEGRRSGYEEGRRAGYAEGLDDGYVPPTAAPYSGRSYSSYDRDCDDFSGPVYVGGDDPHGLDRDGDGVGCE